MSTEVNAARCAWVRRARLAGPATTRLPAGFTVALDRRARRLDDGAALLGGSPGRLLHLAPAARRLLADPSGVLAVGDATSAALARRLLDGGLAHPVPAGDGVALVPADAVKATPWRSRGAACPTAADVTVVVPVRDRPDGLRRLLAALAQTSAGVSDIVVVDDGSADAASHQAITRAAGARLIRHPDAQGPAAARNTGLAAATTDLVAFLDSDVVPQPGWLAPLLAHFADPAVALAAPRIVGLAVPDPSWVARYEQLRSSLDLGRDPAPIVPRSRVAYVPGAALLVRRAVVGAGFDPTMRVAEDVDLVLRLYAAGWRLRYEPASGVAHEHRADPVAWWTRKALYGAGAAPLARRHPGAVPPLVLAPWAAAACVGLASQRRTGVIAAAAVTAVATTRLSRTLHRLRRPWPTAARLATLGLAGALAQVAGAITRHGWPLTVLACLVSRRARRATAAAALVEGVHDWWTHRPEPGRPGLDPLRYLLAHRLDDLGYGSGLWWGAWRGCTLAPLRPVVTRQRRNTSLHQ